MRWWVQFTVCTLEPTASGFTHGGGCRASIVLSSLPGPFSSALPKILQRSFVCHTIYIFLRLKTIPVCNAKD